MKSFGIKEIQGSELENINEQIKSFIDILPKKEGFIDLSQLNMIGQGGTHDVFMYPKNQTFVIKLNRAVLEKSSNFGQAELSPEAHNLAGKYVKDENSKNAQLYRHFGKEHCLCEEIMIQKISLKKDDIISHGLESVISIQEASDIFKDPDRKDFSTGYTEKDLSINENKEIYNKMNKSLLGNDEFNENDFLKFNEKIRPIFELTDQDKEFSNTVKEFLSKFKNYFEESGRFIDLIGQDNVLFHKQNGKWTFKIGSVIKGENKENMKEALIALEKNPEIFNQDEKIRNQFMNQLAFIRLLNATGLKVSIGKIIDIELTEKQLENLNAINFK